MIKNIKINREPYGSRLSWNCLDWVFPSGCSGKCYGSGPSPSNFECIAGFGFEEWLFNVEFRCFENGVEYQYGFIQCFHNNRSKQNHVFEEFLLWTRMCDGSCDKVNRGKFYFLGTIENLEVLDFEFDYNKLTCLKNPIDFLVNETNPKLSEDVKSKLLKYDHPMEQDNRFFNVRFKVSENLEFLNVAKSQPILQSSQNSVSVPGNRFRCYKLGAQQVKVMKCATAI
jgi:hypothetical protein